MITFDEKGILNTDQTLYIAMQEAIKRNSDIVVASSSGATAKKLTELAKMFNFPGNIITVSLAYGYGQGGKNPMNEEIRQELIKDGVKVVTAAHALSGGERSFSKKHHGISTVEIVADTLRMFCAGVKVCVEIALMANDAGTLQYNQPVVCVAGTGTGADTICYITPAYTANLLDTQIHEIIAKPYNK